MKNQRKTKNYNPYGCPVAHFMNQIGGKWKIIVIYALSIKIKRFGKLQQAMPFISKQMLVNVLREMEDDGLVTRMASAETPSRTEYELTELSQSLMPIIALMEHWGLKDLDRLNIKPECNFLDLVSS